MSTSMFHDLFQLTSLTIGLCQGSLFLQGSPAGNEPAAPAVRAPDRRRLARSGRSLAPAAFANGSFTEGSHTAAGRTLAYKLYVPPRVGKRYAGLVVMLHGCSQDPDDFARGTGMNALARQHGFCVLYPAQSSDGHVSRCWSWFKHNHQRRGSGEPAVIAGMTEAILLQHRIDRRNVFIAGMSAGGAMAATVAAEYPDVFAAAAVHSGLPHGAARDAGAALSAMFSGRCEPLPGDGLTAAVPTIVFHGDQDQTVHPSNGERVIAAALACHCGVCAERSPQVQAGTAGANGRRYTRFIYTGCNGAVRGEHWLVHGAGHAWSGGRADGSYTDADGPDATAEMLRFFMAHPRVALS